MEETNKIILKGTIIHMEISQKRILYTLATNVGINHAHPDVAVILKNKVKTEDVKFLPGDKVKLVAHVQYQKTTDENNHNTFLKTFVVDDMKSAEPSEQDEFNIEAIEPEDVNKCMFVGRVVHKYDIPNQNNLKIVTISVRAGGFFNYVDISAFGQFSNAFSEVQEGEYVAVIGEVRTRANARSEKVQNIVCMNMKKIAPENIVSGN